MSRAVYFQDKKVLVMGLGRFGGGVGVTRWLVGQGAQVTVTDLKTESELQGSMRELEISRLVNNIHLALGKHDPKLLDEHELLVVNPAVKPNNEFLKLAQQKGLELTTEMNLFFERCPGRIIGVTGTNGKETVVRMIAGMLEAAGKKPIVGGNIGRSLLETLPTKSQTPSLAGRQANPRVFQWKTSAERKRSGGTQLQINYKHQISNKFKRIIQPNDLVLLELSSFQLERLAWVKKSPEVAVIINITPNHLDWHGTFDNYLQAKANILRWQNHNDVAVLNIDDQAIVNLAELTKGRLVKIRRPDEILRPYLRVPGEHNLWNATIAQAVVKVFGVRDPDIRQALSEYQGTEHALEFVCQRNGVKVYNDSEATTPIATLAAIESFDQPIVLIAGGSDKGVDLRSLVEQMVGKVKMLITIGQTGPKILEILKMVDRGSKVRMASAQSLKQAVKLGFKYARSGDILLLSPACASYDMFSNLQERGKIFKKIACGQ